MTTRPRILVIDDEPQIHRFLGPALDAGGFEPLRATTALAGLTEALRTRPDAVVLDLGLPDLDGQEVLVRLRATYAGPIIILSARDRDEEKIAALDNGADDYVEKPFSVGELMARLRAAMRNKIVQTGVQPLVRAAELEIDLIRRKVTRSGGVVRLSPKEWELLAALVKGGGRVVTQRQLLNKIWGPANEEDVQYLRTYMGHLRQKLEADPSRPRHLVTEAGVGYRFLGDLDS